MYLNTYLNKFVLKCRPSLPMCKYDSCHVTELNNLFVDSQFYELKSNVASLLFLYALGLMHDYKTWIIAKCMLGRAQATSACNYVP